VILLVAALLQPAWPRRQYILILKTSGGDVDALISRKRDLVTLAKEAIESAFRARAGSRKFLVEVLAPFPWHGQGAAKPHHHRLAGNKAPFVYRTHHSPRIGCLRIFLPVADDLKRLSRGLWRQRKRCYRGFQPDLRIGMVEQRKQGSPLIAGPTLQFLFDIIHLAIEAIILGIVIVAHRLMLIQRDGDEALH
jgi:hypothetical protein